VSAPTALVTITASGAIRGRNHAKPPRLDLPQTQVLAIEAQKVEGRQRGLRAAPIG
jgi:hypothetical protein